MESSKIPTVSSEDNTMAKRKRKNRTTYDFQSLQRKLRIE